MCVYICMYVCIYIFLSFNDQNLTREQTVNLHFCKLYSIRFEKGIKRLFWLIELYVSPVKKKQQKNLTKKHKVQTIFWRKTPNESEISFCSWKIKEGSYILIEMQKLDF